MDPTSPVSAPPSPSGSTSTVSDGSVPPPLPSRGRVYTACRNCGCRFHIRRPRCSECGAAKPVPLRLLRHLRRTAQRPSAGAKGGAGAKAAGGVAKAPSTASTVATGTKDRVAWRPPTATCDGATTIETAGCGRLPTTAATHLDEAAAAAPTDAAAAAAGAPPPQDGWSLLAAAAGDAAFAAGEAADAPRPPSTDFCDTFADLLPAASAWAPPPPGATAAALWT